MSQLKAVDRYVAYSQLIENHDSEIKSNLITH